MVLFTVLFTLFSAITGFIAQHFAEYHEGAMTRVAAAVVGGLFGLLISIIIWIVTT